MRRKKKIQTTFTELLDRVLAYETEDHLFHDILTDPSTYKETESVIMVALAIYRAVQAGMLDAKYLERADLLRIAAESKVDEDGLVQDCAGSPTLHLSRNFRGRPDAYDHVGAGI